MSLGIHFWILQCIFIVKFSMSSLKKIRFGIKQSPPQPPTCVSVSQVKCVMFCLRMKKNGNFFHFSVLRNFLMGCFYQFCTSNCRTVFNFLQFQPTLSTSFLREFVKRFDNLLPRPLKFKPNSSLSLHAINATLCYLRLKRSFLAHEFSKYSKFCCRSNVFLSTFWRLIFS